MKTIYLTLAAFLFCVASGLAQKTEYLVDNLFPVTSTTNYTSAQSAGGLTMSPGAASDVTIFRTSNSKKTNDGKYSGVRNLIRLTGPGYPSSGTATPTQRFVSIEVTGSCNITVYAMSGNAGQSSTLNISDGTSTLGTLTSDQSHDTLYGKTVSYTGDGGTIYFYVEDGRYYNFYIGLIVVEPSSGGGTPGESFEEDFETKNIGDTYDLKAWYDTDGTATVVVNPTNASNKAVRIVTSNWDAVLKLNIVLPSGKTLADYESFSFDIYIGDNANDENPNYKNMQVYLNDEKKYEDSGYPIQAEKATWTTKTFTFASLNLTEAEKALSSFAIGFGISTENGDYYIDNVKFTEGASQQAGSGFTFNFNDDTVGDTYDLKAWYDTDGTATVAVDPANAGNKAVRIVTSNWDAVLKLNIVLPSGKTLADYESFSFDIYIGDNANDENPNYKNMQVYLNDEKKYEDSGYPIQAEKATWTTKTFTFASLNLTEAEKALSSFAIGFGISTENGDYYIDNVKFTEKAGTSGPEAGYFIIDDFNDKTAGSALQVKTAHYETDGTASVASDPANSSNKAANVVTTNYNAFLKMDVTLPSGKTLADYESLLFDIYIGTNANDENANYKKMYIYFDDIEKYTDEGYPKQAESAVWTTKTYTFDVLGLTEDEKSKNTFSLALGISTDKGNYYVDNIRLKAVKGTTFVEEISVQSSVYYTNGMIYIPDGKSAAIQIYDMKGRLVLSGQAVASMDVSSLSSGLYIVKANIEGQNQTVKFIR